MIAAIQKAAKGLRVGPIANPVVSKLVNDVENAGSAYNAKNAPKAKQALGQGASDAKKTAALLELVGPKGKKLVPVAKEASVDLEKLKAKFGFEKLPAYAKGLTKQIKAKSSK